MFISIGGITSAEWRPSLREKLTDDSRTAYVNMADDSVRVFENRFAQVPIETITFREFIKKYTPDLTLSEIASEYGRIYISQNYYGIGNWDRDTPERTLYDLGIRFWELGWYVRVVGFNKISYVPKDKLIYLNHYEQYDKMKGRVETTFGRFIRKIYPDMGDVDVEKKVDALKSKFHPPDYKLEIVTGVAIANAYTEYISSPCGSLSGSCMQGLKSSTFEFYVKNSNIGLLTARDAKGNLKGRALVWTATDGKQYMDRVYSNTLTEIYMRSWATKHGLVPIIHHNAPKFTVELDVAHVNHYPYLDNVNVLTKHHVSTVEPKKGRWINIRTQSGRGNINGSLWANLKIYHNDDLLLEKEINQHDMNLIETRERRFSNKYRLVIEALDIPVNDVEIRGRVDIDVTNDILAIVNAKSGESYSRKSILWEYLRTHVDPTLPEEPGDIPNSLWQNEKYERANTLIENSRNRGGIAVYAEYLLANNRNFEEMINGSKTTDQSR